MLASNNLEYLSYVCSKNRMNSLREYLLTLSLGPGIMLSSFLQREHARLGLCTIANSCLFEEPISIKQLPVIRSCLQFRHVIFRIIEFCVKVRHFDRSGVLLQIGVEI